MTDDEFRTFTELLQRYCEEDLDQWSLWRLATGHGYVYVSVSRYPEAGASPEAYDRIGASGPA
jgi:hypothetical protein